MERSCKEIRLADFDHLDLSNLNRIRTALHNLGLNKAIITAREISEIDPFIRVRCFTDGVTDENIENFILYEGKLDLLIDECDSLDMKVQLRNTARSHRIPVVMDTSDKGLLDIERFDLEPERQIFHGLIGDLDPEALKELSTKDKIPIVLKITGEDSISTRLKASLIEIDTTIKTWPQLASSVILGGAVAADVSRRILLNQTSESGRYFVDLEELIPNKKEDYSEDNCSAKDIISPPLDREMMMASAEEVRHKPKNDVVTIDRTFVEKLVSCAILAPSGGNTQPWKWLCYEKSLFLIF